MNLQPACCSTDVGDICPHRGPRDKTLCSLRDILEASLLFSWITQHEGVMLGTGAAFLSPRGKPLWAEPGRVITCIIQLQQAQSPLAATKEKADKSKLSVHTGPCMTQFVNACLHHPVQVGDRKGKRSGQSPCATRRRDHPRLSNEP